MSDGRRLLVLGDALLDVDLDGEARRLCPDAPAPVIEAPRESARPGGAGLAAWMLARDGHEVTLATALGDDAAGARVRALLEERGVRVLDLGGAGTTPEKVRIRASGHVLARLDRGGPPVVRTRPIELRAALGAADAVLVADYGQGISADEAVRRAFGRACDRVPVVWDPHPRGALPVPGVALLTPNAAEARGLLGTLGRDGHPEPATALRAHLAARAVAVTQGARGAVLAGADGAPVTVAPVRTAPADADPLGAGDRFASAAAAALAGGGDVHDAVRDAVQRAADFVCDGGVAAMNRPGGEEAALALAARVRAAGGTVVATGGCFDIVHAGHVASLSAARALGDCLVVLLNSDASVRRLKGPSRPVMSEGERAALLRALRCVDAVLVFDEDTPQAALERLRPHVFAKGADYDPALLPEAETMRRLGGRVASLPFVPGRSTTRIIEEVRAHAGG
ncbi:MAG TPA: PfkB family carbohydrate kinase [Miltoncostaeaceae bacterium]|nr:PfkB family carbohydrate kinase [Miltoncostaeaceae bacterium]